MRDYRIAHPTDPTVTASVGWDHTMGYWAEIRRRGERPECIDWMTPGFDVERPLWCVLCNIAERGFFGAECSLELALLAMENGTVDELDPGEKKAVEVVEYLKKISD